jgi:transposase InsO family protein
MISLRGQTTDDAFIESFNGKFRAECLNAHWFMSLDDARRKCEAWRKDYNEERLTARSAQRPDRADRSVSGIRPALTGTGWKKASSPVQGWDTPAHQRHTTRG